MNEMWDIYGIIDEICLFGEEEWEPLLGVSES